MAYYSGTQVQSTVVAADTVHHILGGAAARGGLCELVVSSDSAVNEYNSKYVVTRTTSTGTTALGSVTEQKLSTFSPTPACTYEGGGYTTEPTPSVPVAVDFVMAFGLHQKAIYRWVAYPGREIWSIPTASNGLALVVLAQSTSHTIDSTITWLE